MPGKGCAKYCNTTKTVAECCKGFYGPDCKPCIGGFENPCFGNGTCSDGMNGDGSCSCRPGFKGVACHLCSDHRKHGENCDEECRCVHGVCDNRPGSRGRCRFGPCSEGFSGDFCDKQKMACNSDGLMEHCHIHAVCSYSGVDTVCTCRDGYEGDGHSCSPINPCVKSSRGDCDVNVSSSVCLETLKVTGWSGDGKVCVEINLCQSESRGGCSPYATCTHVGPAQAECVCKRGYSGNGKVCDLLNPCRENNRGCHELATCKQLEGRVPSCICPDGYHGNGTTCYGTVIETRRDIPAEFYGNITVLAPSVQSHFMFWHKQRSALHLLR
uniref:EGF-like domain-containing protein n=1 Tax=Knipowitschia caucasica TaxID=637954 RepID=A0AAV2MLG1_KNICA